MPRPLSICTFDPYPLWFSQRSFGTLRTAEDDSRRLSEHKSSSITRDLAVRQALLPLLESTERDGLDRVCRRPGTVDEAREARSHALGAPGTMKPTTRKLAPSVLFRFPAVRRASRRKFLRGQLSPVRERRRPQPAGLSGTARIVVDAHDHGPHAAPTGRPIAQEHDESWRAWALGAPTSPHELLRSRIRKS